MPIPFSDIKTKVNYYSGAPLDKIVRIFTGTYQSTDLVTRVGTLGTAYVYRIAHGLGRPVFCDVLTSTTGGVTYDGGVSKIAFSDSTYAYIFHGLAASGPVTYKLYCTWIDSYDSTNPSITAVTYPSNQVEFDSRLNYQKLYLQQELSFTPGTFGSSQTQTITHPLGYAPNAKVYFEPFAGEVWPLNVGGAGNPFLYDGAQDECEADIYSTRIDVIYSRFSNATRRAWVRLYFDAN